MEKVNPDQKTIRKFSLTMFLALAIIGTFLFLRHKGPYAWFYAAGLILFLMGVFAKGALRPVYIFWMKLSSLLSWINTRLILFAIFYLVFTPIGLILRLFQVDLLDKKIESTKESYWKIKEDKDSFQGNYERQF